MKFREKLSKIVQKNNSMVCVGLDPDPVKMPIKSIFEFCKIIIDSTSDLVAAYKPNFAFFEALGIDGLIELKKTVEYLQSKHPDFDEIRGDDRFHNWAKEQPEQIQDWIYNNPNNVELAVKALDLYKLENGLSTTKQTKKSPQSRQNAADFVSTKTTTVDPKEPKIWTQREIAAMSMRDFDKFEDEIDQAMAEGRVRP